MPRLIAFVGAAALSLFAAQATAEGLLTHCSTDIETLCADVEPGDGRVMSCLYAHSAVITDECHAATDGMARLMEGFFDRVAEVSEACATDLQDHCTGVPAGGGAKFQCLRDLGGDLSSDCANMLESMAQQ
ncbi:MAG: cysteine rich repeat-containing protein [Pseudomonadota bacterium]